MSNKYTTKDIVTLVVIGVILGIASTANGFLFSAMFVLPYGNILSGLIGFVWYIAGPLAIFLVRKPGMAFLGEMVMGVISTVTGHPAGIAMLAWTFLEGIGAELPFLATGYKKFGLIHMMTAAELQAALSYWWGVYFYGTFQYGSAAVWYPYFAFLATAWLGGVIAYYVGKALAKTGVVSKDIKA